MKTRICIMRPGQPDESQEIDLAAKPGYDKLRSVIDPVIMADFERVAVWADFEGGTKYKALDMFVDDTGLLKNLPRNEAATTIYRRANLMGMSASPPVPDPEILSDIRGPAILFDRRVWF